MIFVHARKETVKTAECMADLSGKYCTTDLLQNFEHEKYTLWKKQVHMYMCFFNDTLCLLVVIFSSCATNRTRSRTFFFYFNFTKISTIVF